MRFVTAFFASLALFGCTVPANKFPQATSIEDYCEGAAGSASIWATSYRDHGDDFDYAKGAVLYESVRFSDPSQKQERVKMVDVLTYVYEHPAKTPEDIHDAVYALCVKERIAGTWFHN